MATEAGAGEFEEAEAAGPAADDAVHTEPEENEDAQHRRSPSGKVVYNAILREADEELARPSSALFWSGLAAGLSMGFSLVAQGLLRHHLPAGQRWTLLVEKLGYSVGFIIVILGRQQLFTENTLTPILPLLLRKDARTLAQVARLWAVVLVANLVGALLFAAVLMHTDIFDAALRQEFVTIGHEAMLGSFGQTLLRAIFAGWLIALIVWMLPFAHNLHFFVILLITWLVGVGHFSHVIAGAIDVFAVAFADQKSWLAVLGNFVAPALLGNILGGVTLVAALNHAQVVAGKAG